MKEVKSTDRLQLGWLEAQPSKRNQQTDTSSTPSDDVPAAVFALFRHRPLSPLTLSAAPRRPEIRRPDPIRSSST